MNGFNKEYFVAITGIEVVVDLEIDIIPDTTGENSEIEDPDILVSDVLRHSPGDTSPT